MKILKQFIKIIFTIFLFYLIFRKVPLNSIKENFLYANKIYLFLAFIFFFLYYLFFAIRWAYLLNGAGIKINFIKAFIYIIISFFFNNVLPSAVGQDFVRSAFASKKDFTKTLGVSLMDRFLGFLGMLIIGITAFLSHYKNLKIISIFYLFLFLFLLFLYLIFTNKNIGRGLKDFILRIKFLNLGEELRKFYLALVSFKEKKRMFLFGIILSIIIQFTITIINYIISKSINIELSFFNLLVILPAITVLSLIPITLNGLGLREFAYIYFFNIININSEKALSLSLMFFIISVIASLIGGILFLFFKGEK